MSALIVNNVLTSSVNITYDYFNTDELFGYTVQGTYQVNISDIEFQQNDTVLLSARDAIKEAYGRPNVVARIGADEYLNGRVTDFSFEAGTLVGSETVTINIEEARRLDDYSSSQFAKYIPNPHSLETFAETYTFSRVAENYSSTRNISLKYKQSAGDQFLNNAKTFLTNYYFANRPALGYQEDGISENAKIDKSFRGVLTETYDLIGLSVSLSEKVDSSFVDEVRSVGRKETQTLSINEKGFLEKGITIELVALRRDSENVLTTALGEIIDEISSNEEEEFGSPYSVSKGITKDGKKASLSLSFSTDPKKSQDNAVGYSGAENKVGRYTEYSLTLMYQSVGENKYAAFNNCKAYWISDQSVNPSRVIRLFHPQSDFYEKSRNTNFLNSDAKINETIVFTTDPAYKTNDDGLLKLKKTISKTRQINRIEKIFDLSNKEEQVVVSDYKTVGQASLRAEATASQSMGLFKAKEILESKTDEFNDYVDEDIIHIVSDVLSINLGDGKSTRSINYLFIEE
tara:strand:+ start:174 stop:1721 length:1548 start_codon:yes stop_codon:yes gene_type:complete